MKYLINITLSAVFMLASCDEESKTITTDDVTVTFSSPSVQAVTCNYYSTEADYNSATNVLKTIEISPKASIDVAGFQKNKNYYYDCYSQDGTSTNWAGIEGSNKFSTTGNGAQLVNLGVTDSTWHRNMLLPGGVYESTWKVVAGMNRDRTTYVTLDSEQDKSRKFKIRRDGTAQYEYVNEQNQSKQDEVFFRIEQIRFSNAKYFYMGVYTHKKSATPLFSISGPFSITDPAYLGYNKTDSMTMTGTYVPQLLITRQ